MIFLIEYNRPTGTLVSLKEFKDSDRAEAQSARLELELHLFREGIHHEVVTLEAASMEAVLKTHGRYFQSFAEIIESFKGL